VTLYRVTAQSLEVLSVSAANVRATAQSLEVLSGTYQVRMPKSYALAVLGIGPGPAVQKAYSLAVLDDGSYPAYDPYWSNVVLLCHFDGSNGATSTVDSSTSAKALTVNGNAQLSTAQSKFGGSSVLLDGTGDYISAADSPDWSFGTGAFTVEFWTRISSVNTQIGFIGQYESGGPAATASWLFSRNTSLEFRMVNSGGTGLTLTAAWTPIANTWYHLCVDREAGGTVRIYVDGVVLGTSVSALAGDIRDVATTPLRIGRSTGTGGTDVNGYIEDVRITKGICRYGGQFSVPQTAYPDYGLITGTASNTLAGVTSTGAGAHGVAGTAVNTLASVTSAGVGAHGVAGTAGNTLAGVTSSASGEFTNGTEGTATNALAALTSSASGTAIPPEVTGTGADTLAALTSSAAGTFTVTGTASNPLEALTSAGGGTLTYSGTASNTLAALTSTGAGTHLAPVTGLAADTLAALTSTGAGTHLAPVIGTATNTLAALTSDATGIHLAPIIGVGETTLASLIGTGTGTVTWPPPRVRKVYLMASKRTVTLSGTVRGYVSG
jgi:hypothetical protein